MWKIYTPVKETNGVRASVRFVNGVGKTDNPNLVKWFKQRGYVVEGDNLTEVPVEKCDDSTEILAKKCDEPDFDGMTPNELREWMKANGYGLKIKNIRDKEKLMRIIRG